MLVFKAEGKRRWWPKCPRIGQVDFVDPSPACGSPASSEPGSCSQFR